MQPTPSSEAPTGGIPGIEVSTDHHDLVGPLASRDFADHVGALDVGKRRGRHPELHGDRHAACDEAGEALRVLDRHGRRRNLRRALQVAHGARVGRTQADGAHRPHEHSHGAMTGGVDRAIGAIGDGLAVARERHVVEDDPPRHLGGPLVQFIEAADHEQRGSDAVRGRADAAAEAQHHEGRRDRGLDRERLVTAHPVGCHRLLEADVLESVGAHRLGGPFACELQVARTGQPPAERVAQLREAIPRGGRADAGVDEALHVALVGREPRARWRLSAPAGTGGPHARRRERRAWRSGSGDGSASPAIICELRPVGETLRTKVVSAGRRLGLSRDGSHRAGRSALRTTVARARAGDRSPAGRAGPSASTAEYQESRQFERRRRSSCDHESRRPHYAVPGQSEARPLRR